MEMLEFKYDALQRNMNQSSVGLLQSICLMGHGVKSVKDDNDLRKTLMECQKETSH